jgi:hypothetical protein
MKKINTKLKIALTLTKTNQKVFMYPSVRKMQIFLRNKAESYLKNDYLITIRVLYKEGGFNSGTYSNIKDLKWAFQSFVKEYL